MQMSPDVVILSLQFSASLFMGLDYFVARDRLVSWSEGCAKAFELAGAKSRSWLSKRWAKGIISVRAFLIWLSTLWAFTLLFVNTLICENSKQLHCFQTLSESLRWMFLPEVLRNEGNPYLWISVEYALGILAVYALVQLVILAILILSFTFTKLFSLIARQKGVVAAIGIGFLWTSFAIRYSKIS